MSKKPKHPKFDIIGKTYFSIDKEFNAGYKVTGFYFNSTKRFSSTYSSSAIALNINLWRGRVWGLRKDGTKQIIRTVYN